MFPAGTLCQPSDGVLLRPAAPLGSSCSRSATMTPLICRSLQSGPIPAVRAFSLPPDPADPTCRRPAKKRRLTGDGEPSSIANLAHFTLQWKLDSAVRDRGLVLGQDPVEHAPDPEHAVMS